MRKVSDVMTGALLAVSQNTSVEEAAQMMADANMGSVVVMKGNAVVGMCTERDILTKVVSKGIQPGMCRVSEVMTKDPLVVQASTPFVSALVSMKEHGFRHMPVIDEGRVVGVVSLRDALPKELEEESRMSARIKELSESL